MKKLIAVSMAILILLVGLMIYFKIPMEVLTAFIGLVGVFVGGLVSYLTIRNENKIQRSIEIKKAIYFEASESIARMRATLASMATIDLKTISADINQINGLQKIDLIAGIELIEKLNICSHYYQTALQEMIFDKLEIDTINQNAKYALDRHSEYLELMKMGSQDLDSLNKKMDDCLDYHSKIIDDLPAKQLQLSEKSIRHTAKFGTLLSDCIPIMRKDIEHSFNAADKNSYQQLIETSNQKSLESGMGFLENLGVKIKNFEFPNL
jgi:hypothetical protein